MHVKGGMIMAHDPTALHMEEFKQLKSEIGTLLQRIETLIKFSLFGGVAIYAWILTHVPESTAAAFGSSNVAFLAVASYLPPAVLFFSASLSALTYAHVMVTARYLCRLEVLLGFSHYGWEAYWAKAPRSLTYALVAFFIVLLIVELGISYYMADSFCVNKGLRPGEGNRD